MPLALAPRRRRAQGEVGASAAARSGETTERLTFWLFILGLAWVPYWYGSNALVAWSINAVLFPGLAAFYELSLLARGKSHPVAIGNLALPAALFLVSASWAWFQTITWGPSALANSIWGMAAQVLGAPVDQSITVNRDLTNLALLRLVTAGSVFWVALQLGRDTARAVLLLRAIAVIAFTYAAYGVLVVTFRSLSLPGLEIAPDGALLSATFINRNTFATYAGLGLIALVGLLLRLYRHEMIGAEAGWRLQLASLVEATGSKAAVPLAAAFIILVALLLTGSRGGVIATIAGLFVLGVLTHRRIGRSMTRTFFVVTPVILLGVATLFAFGGAFVDSMEQRSIYDSNRLSVDLLTIRSILDHPLLGNGYGTFVDVFPLYRDRSISVQGTWGQAHNTYLEAFQGLGLVFGSMLVASVLLTVLRCLKGAINRREHVTVPRVAVAAAALVGVHSLVDFSLQIQAVALTFIALLGAGLAQSKAPEALHGD
jgi:O-antigen ligase